jgi:hypothetical protein
MKGLLLIMLSLSLAGCKKVKENIQEGLAMEFITKGQWKIANYLSAGQDKTAELNAYTFQFKSNRTVDALKNGTLETTGTWQENQANRTIFSNFTSASYPLILLNATWSVTNGSETSITAKANVNGETRNLRLEKN